MLVFLFNLSEGIWYIQGTIVKNLTKTMEIIIDFFFIWKKCDIMIWPLIEKSQRGRYALLDTGSRGDVFVRKSKPVENLLKKWVIWSHCVDRKPKDWGLRRSASVALWATCRAPARIWLAVIDFQNFRYLMTGLRKYYCSNSAKIPGDVIGAENTKTKRSNGQYSVEYWNRHPSKTCPKPAKNYQFSPLPLL